MFDVWVPETLKCLLLQTLQWSHHLLKRLPLWSKWVHSLFLPLLCWQVQIPSWIAPPTPHRESQAENLGTALAKLEITAGGKKPAGTLAEITQVRNINRQRTLQSVLLSPWKCLCTDFPDDLCYIPEMQILPHALNKCICAVLMFWLNKAVSFPMLPCLVSLGVGWGLHDIPNSHILVRSDHYYCFVIIAVQSVFI